jgi:hypothetical protein
MDQAHQYGLKVPPLGRANNLSKVCQIVAKGAFLDDNRVGHVFLLNWMVVHPIFRENVAFGYDFVKSAKLLLKYKYLLFGYHST